MWPVRRTLSRTERAWVAVIAVLLAGYVAHIPAPADWSAHPVLASLAAVCGLGAVVALVAIIRVAATFWCARRRADTEVADALDQRPASPPPPAGKRQQ